MIPPCCIFQSHREALRRRLSGTIACKRRLFRFEMGAGGRWLDEIVHATRRTDLAPEPDERLIDWTFEEAEAIFDKIDAWWQQEGQQMCSEERNLFLETKADARVTGILETLRVTIGPRCTATQGLAVKVRTLLYDIEKAGFPVENALSSVVGVLPDLGAELADRIRRGLVSPRSDAARAALQGLHDWWVRADAREIEAPPDDLLRELGSIVSTRRQPAIRHAIYVAEALVGRMGSNLDQTLVKALCVGLHYLLEETEYHCVWQISMAP